MNFGRNPRLYKSTVAAIARDSVRYALIKPVLDRAVKAHVHGLEHLDDLRAPFLVTPNHSGHFDGPLIMLTMPSRLTKELATGAAADYFFTKWYTAMGTQLLMNAFPVDRARNKGRNHRGMSGELLDAGVSLLIFPEGTRSRTGDVHVVYGAPMTAEPGEIAHEFSERVRRKIIEMHDGVARAYGMPTQAEMMHLAAIERARRSDGGKH